MKSLTFFALATAVLATAFPVGISRAQTVSSASDLLAAVNALQQVDSARQVILGQVNVQLAQVTEESQNLPSEPRNTVNEQAAYVAEVGNIAAKLSQLSNVATTLDQIQAVEISLTSTIQSDMHSLGL